MIKVSGRNHVTLAVSDLDRSLAFYRDKLPHWSFVIVASSMSALLMLGWRGVVALAQKRR